MKSAMANVITRSKALALAALVLTCSPAALADGDKPWTSIGSDGTVDEGAITFTSNIAYLDADSAVIRYNVVAVDGIVDAGLAAPFPRLTARFRDNGGNGRVLVRLMRAGINGGNTVALLTLDSNDYPGSSSFQTRSVTGCGDDAFTFDFVDHTYFVEVTMTRTGLPVTPGLAALKLDLGGGCIAGAFQS